MIVRPPFKYLEKESATCMDKVIFKEINQLNLDDCFLEFVYLRRSLLKRAKLIKLESIALWSLKIKRAASASQ